ncbi:MAG: protein phosphatase 2C domain-containing protein [Propionibacteriales bacterium]|nr:protein phosphatase 2C domain-containing protein [Propionibacteriales bacterium]
MATPIPSPDSPVTPGSPGTPNADPDRDGPDETAEQERDAEASSADHSRADTTTGRLHLRFAAKSHVGLIRKNNQDSGYASPTMLVVADGMGGAAAGDLASAVAIDAVSRADTEGPDASHRRDLVVGEDMLETLAGAISRANDKIADLVADDHALEGMGTTVSGTMFDGERLGVCHIGDSRIYRLRHDEQGNGELERLTHDHSWVQSLVDDGKITEEEAAYHSHRSLLLKVLNGHPTNDPDVKLIDVAEGDRLILCSDGLCGFVEDDVMAEIAAEGTTDQALADLIEAALQAGGPDNVTVIVADVVTEAPPAAAPLLLGAATEIEIPASKPIKVDLGDSPITDDDSPLVPSAPRPDGDDEEDQRYAVRPPPRGRWFRRLVTAVAVLLILGALVGGGWAWGRTQFYVGAAGDDVAIYQGLPQNVVGIGLSQVYEVQQVQLDDLPVYYQERVRGAITANSLDSARQTVDELKTAAEACRAKRTPKKEPQPTPSGKPPTSVRPTSSAPPTPSPSTSSSSSSTSSPDQVPC